jgi:hypothetical protein
VRINRKTILSIGCLLLILACLFPPWKEVVVLQLSQNVSIEKNLRYQFLLSPPPAARYETAISVVKIDWERHFLLVVVIAVSTSVIIFVVGKNEFYSNEIKNRLLSFYGIKAKSNYDKKESEIKSEQPLELPLKIDSNIGGSFESESLKNSNEMRFIIESHDELGCNLTVERLRELIYSGLVKDTDACIEVRSNNKFVIRDILENKNIVTIVDESPVSKFKANSESAPSNSVGTGKPSNVLFEAIKKNPLIAIIVAFSLFLDFTGLLNMFMHQVNRHVTAAPLSTLLIIYSIGIALFIKSKISFDFSTGFAIIYCGVMYLFWIFINLIYSTEVYRPSLLFGLCLIATYQIMKSNEVLDKSVYSQILKSPINQILIGCFIFLSAATNTSYVIRFDKISAFSGAVILTLSVLAIFFLGSGIQRLKTKFLS